jgi:hypothetical protein
VPYAIGAAFTFGVLVGSFITWGLDRAELAAYRRIAREAARAAARGWPDQ